jgi:hypothetical protein
MERNPRYKRSENTNIIMKDLAGFNKKFAELIVKECMEVASPNYISTPEDIAYYVELAIDRIADHFGVEE